MTVVVNNQISNPNLTHHRPFPVTIIANTTSGHTRAVNNPEDQLGNSSSGPLSFDEGRAALGAGIPIVKPLIVTRDSDEVRYREGASRGLPRLPSTSDSDNEEEDEEKEEEEEEKKKKKLQRKLLPSSRGWPQPVTTRACDAGILMQDSGGASRSGLAS